MPHDPVEPALEHYYRNQSPPFLERNLKAVFNKERHIVGLTGDILEKRAHGSGDEERVFKQKDPNYKAISGLALSSRKHKQRPVFAAQSVGKPWRKAAKKAIQAFDSIEAQPLVRDGDFDFCKLELSGSPSEFTRDVEAILTLKIQASCLPMEINMTTSTLGEIKPLLKSKAYTDALIVLQNKTVSLGTTVLSRSFILGHRTETPKIEATLIVKNGDRVSKYSGTINAEHRIHELNPVESVDGVYKLNMRFVFRPFRPVNLSYTCGSRTFGPYKSWCCPFSGREFDSLNELLNFHSIFHPSIIVRKTSNSNDVVLAITAHRDNARHEDDISYTDHDSYAGLDEFYYVNPFYGMMNEGIDAMVPIESYFSRDLYHEEARYEQRSEEILPKKKVRKS